MSDRDGYQPGVPCWVDLLAPDVAATVGFYGELLGWEFDGPGPGQYFVARTRGRDVAGVGAQPPGVPTAWNTYVSVASAERAAEAAAGAGGQVVMAPADGESHWSVGFWVGDADAVAARAAQLGGAVVAPPSDAGGMRQAVLADPHGATFSVTTAPHG